MKVLIIGSGGREHALAWKVAQSPIVKGLWVAPGNAGTELLVERRGLAGGNVPLNAENVPELLDFAETVGIDLTIVGPEAPLALGIVDAFLRRKLAIFGPTQAGAQIEASKAFAKDFMARHKIPTARFAVFEDYQQAVEYLRQADFPVVVKASGLAAGKGVFVPEDRTRAEKALYEMLVRRAFGEAGEQVIIEERLYGQELSVLALSDGRTVVPLLPAQDYKRAFDGDQGPNTGGMGAYAPVPFVSQELLQEIQRTILQPAVDGLRKEGIPYVGVLYAGLMLTTQGPRVLEFNCRFGDPETQVVLPLLENDLVEVIQACIAGKLKDVRLGFRPAAAVTVVLASRGYPGPYEKGMVIQGLEHAEALDDVIVFHAGTRRAGQNIVTNGGRVLNVTAVAPSLSDAVARAYEAVQHISFEGMHYRRDIGRSALQAMRTGGGDGA